MTDNTKVYRSSMTAEEMETALRSVPNKISKDLIQTGFYNPTDENVPSTKLLFDQLETIGQRFSSLGLFSSKDNVDLSTTEVVGVAPITKGGTGAATAAGARENLGILDEIEITRMIDSRVADQITEVDLNSEVVTGILPVSKGGTGGSSATSSRNNLDVYSKGQVDLALSNIDVDKDDTYSRYFNSVPDMLASGGLVVGNRYSTGSTVWKCVSLPVTDITSFQALNDLHVLDFGAVGDGVQDDTAAIQNACLAASWQPGTARVISSSRLTHLITSTIEVTGYKTVVCLNGANVKSVGNFLIFKIIQCQTFGGIDFYMYGDPTNQNNKAVQIGKSHTDTFTSIGNATNLTLRIENINFETTCNTGIYSELELDNSVIENIRTWAHGDWGNCVIDVRGHNPLDRSRSVGLTLKRIHLVGNPDTPTHPTRLHTAIRMKSTEHSTIDAIINGFDVDVDLETSNPKCTTTYNQVMYVTMTLHKDIDLTNSTLLKNNKTFTVGSIYTAAPSRYFANPHLGHWYQCTQSGFADNTVDITALDSTGAEFSFGAAKFVCKGFSCAVRVGNTQGVKIKDSYMRSNGILFSQTTDNESVGVVISGGIIEYTNGVIYSRARGGIGSVSVIDSAWIWGFLADINMNVTIAAGCKLISNGVIADGFLKETYNNREVKNLIYKSVTVTETTTFTEPTDVVVGDLTGDIQIFFTGAISKTAKVNIINMNSNRNKLIQVFAGDVIENIVNYKDQLTLIWTSSGKVGSVLSTYTSGLQSSKYTSPTSDILMDQNKRNVFIHDLVQDITVTTNRDLANGTEINVMVLNPNGFSVKVRGTHGFWGDGAADRVAGYSLDTHGDWAIVNNWQDQKSYIRSNKTTTDPWPTA